MESKDTRAVQPVAVIINPISGTGGRPDVARRRADLAASLITSRGFEALVFVTERPGHARELTRVALSRGASVVAAWGGDGTVNEVASALAFGSAALAIIPSGSGNGLARELGIPWSADAAIDVALSGAVREIDAGELDGRLFFNVGGCGLDARVARGFARNGLQRRGFTRYLEITLRELLAFRGEDLTVVTDGDVLTVRVLILAIANGRQYGNGALIAPDARLDDGRLDVVIVEDRPRLRALLQMPQVFMGRIARVPGVTIRSVQQLTVTATEPLVYHVDGEPHVGSVSIGACVHPRALRVKVPFSY